MNLGDKILLSDNDSAVEKTVEILSDDGSDVFTLRQEKETWAIGGILSL